MTISSERQRKIIEEYDAWKDTQYLDKDKKERQRKGQFFTPPELSIRMLEKFDNCEGPILDPCMGAGGLLAAAIIAGWDSKEVYGIELDPDVYNLAVERLTALGVPAGNLINGDVFDEKVWEKLPCTQ